MFFNSFNEFIDMGGHGFYVWLAFGVSIAVLVYLLVNPVIKKRKFFVELKSQIQLEKRRQQSSQSNLSDNIGNV